MDHFRHAGTLSLAIASDNRLHILRDDRWLEDLVWRQEQTDKAVSTYRALLRQMLAHSM